MSSETCSPSCTTWWRGLLYSLLVVAYPMPSALLFSSSGALTAFRGIFPPLRVSSRRCWSGGMNRRSVFLLLLSSNPDRWSDTDKAPRLLVFMPPLQRGFFFLFFFHRAFLSPCASSCSIGSPASTALRLRSRFWAHRWRDGITPRGRRRRRGVERGGSGGRCRRWFPNRGPLSHGRWLMSESPSKDSFILLYFVYVWRTLPSF